MSAWPSYNPFPFQATSPTPSSAAELVNPPSGGVTILFPHVVRTGDIVRDYLRTYGTIGATGRAVALNGEHGSGKSHTIRHLVERITNGSWQRQGVCPAVKLAVRVEGADFVTVYRQLMSQLDLELLVSAARKSFAALAGEEWVEKASSDAAKGMIQNRLDSDSGAAMDAFRRYLVDRDAVDAKQARDFGKLGEGRVDFQRAVPFILSDNNELAKLAHLWLIGVPLAEEDRLKLGVTGNIDAVEVCKSALELVATLFNRGGRPLLIFIDQYEKLIKEATPEQFAANLAMMRRFVEVLPKENALFLIAGTEDAWSRFTEDLKDRFRPGLVTLPRLEREQTTEVIAAYVDSARPAELRGSAKDPFPFADDAVEALHRFSRGTLRLLLQSARTLFESAFASTSRTEIHAADVERGVADGSINPPSTTTDVTAIIEERLELSGVSWRKWFPFDDFLKADFAVVDADESPRLVIEVKNAAFYDEEAKNAQRLVSMIARWQATRGVRPRVVMIVTGYVSKQVVEMLTTGSLQNVVQVIVFDPLTFRKELDALLSGVRSLPPAAKPAEDGKLLGELDRVRKELESVRRQRESDVGQLEGRLQELISGTTRVPAEPVGLVNERWRDERRGLQKEIAEAREKRAKTEFEQLRRASRREEQLRVRRQALMTVATVAGIAVLMLFFRLRVELMRQVSQLDIVVMNYAFIFGGILIALVIVAFVALYFRALEPSIVHAAAGNIDSLEDLEQLRLYEGRAVRYIWHSNPQVRFVAWQSADLAGRPLGDFLDRFEDERLPVVRRAAAEAMAAGDFPAGKELGKCFERPEFAYVIDRQGKVDHSAAPPNMRLVAAIGEARRGGSYKHAFDLLLNKFLVSQALAEAFLKDEPVGIDVFGRQECRNALNLLSPFEEEGIGTLDHLKTIDTVDDLYLFFKREQFFAERGIA
jgi:hypothetical protein